MKLPIIAATTFCLLLLGCDRTVRSISSSGYIEKPGFHAHTPPPTVTPEFQYRGELSEFDVLGITPGATASESEIRRALDNAKRVKLHSDSSLLLIQSGAAFPDGGMVTELTKHFQVVPFSGIPHFRPEQSVYSLGSTRASRVPAGALASRNDTETIAPSQTDSFRPESYSRLLRLAAAKGGNDTIVCYWGILESETKDLATKTVSWMPVVNWIVPDETQHMRIRLKVALIDVRTGNWSVFSPKPFEQSNISRSPRRAAVDQKQVERLKAEAYSASAKELVRLYSDVASAK